MEKLSATDLNETNNINRRNAIRAFGFAGITALSATAAPAFSEIKGNAPSGKAAYLVFASVDNMKRDRSLKKDTLVRLAGYYTPGDGGGAEYLIKDAGTEGDWGTIPLDSGLYASLVNVSGVNYRMFGAVGDGKNDDGVQIKMAHAYANRMNIPLINQSGEFWIRETHTIEIMTSVYWGQTIFHIDEKYNTPSDHKFIISSLDKPVALDLTPETKSKLLAQIKPGVTLIPELAPYKNSLLVFTDTNDRVGVRSGAAYNGRSTKAREEFFFVEEHGRVLGDVAWSFNDFTKITAYPGSDSYLIIDGGTFYFSGERTNFDTTGYVRMGFSVNRSRTIIRNQWVGLEKGKADVAMAPRTGFYNFSCVYDVLLENVRMIPWEKDRPGTENDVLHGTYGIGGSYVLNATFRNVTAEGSPVHWGVFGTNLFKNFRVEQCVLNRVDVHFYCLNLYIKDSKIGTNGITITGGGDLFVENTTCRSNNFISFRNDFGAKWDGDIRIRNCRHAPTGSGNVAILSMVADDFDYKYPIGYGRTLRVEDMVIDFNTNPTSQGIARLMRISSFSQAKDGRRVFFPSLMEFRNIVVEGRQKGMRIMEINDPQSLKLARAGSYDGVQLNTNTRMIFTNIQLEDLPASENHLILRNISGSKYDEWGLYPQIKVSQCGTFAADLGAGIADVVVEDCKITNFTGSGSGVMPGSLTFMHCRFEANVKETEEVFYKLSAELGTGFINCTLLSPQVAGQAQPGMIDRSGIVQINKSVKYNHINTRLGNDLLRYFKAKGTRLNERFISMLKTHHELESPDI